MRNFDYITYGGPDELALAVAEDWIDLLDNSVAPQLVALSGGRIVKTLFEEVAKMSVEFPHALPKVEFFWADERCVPPDSPDSNYRLAKETLFDKVPISPGKIHRLKGELPPVDAAAQASAELLGMARKKDGVPVFDLIFLGAGEDGHIASLMPNVPENVSHSSSPFVAIVNSPKPPPNRLSITYPVIAAAKSVWVVVSGAGKEAALRQSLEPGGLTPLGRVLQSREHTVIYSDIKI